MAWLEKPIGNMDVLNSNARFVKVMRRVYTTGMPELGIEGEIRS